MGEIQSSQYSYFYHFSKYVGRHYDCEKNVVINGITLTAKTLVLFGILQCFIFWQIQIILFVYSAMAEITLLRGSFPTQ